MEYYITIGMDLGNKNHKIVALKPDGSIAFRQEIGNCHEALEPFFKAHKDALVAMETGTCCRWISALAKACGCDVIVGNARKLRAIWESNTKNDWNDALMLARLAKASRDLFHPVKLRDSEHQDLLHLLMARDIVVRQRTQLVNSIRGVCKSDGYILGKCDAAGFHRHREMIPACEMWKLGPQLDLLEKIAEVIKDYDRRLKDYADEHFHDEVKNLRTIPGVGLDTSCAYVALIRDPKEFGKARSAGSYIGLTPKQDQSGDSDNPRRITKAGNRFLRKLLINAANYNMRKDAKPSYLQDYALRIWAGRGKIAKRKAKVALARKLAVIMMAMLQSGKPYVERKAMNVNDNNNQEELMAA